MNETIDGFIAVQGAPHDSLFPTFISAERRVIRPSGILSQVDAGQQIILKGGV